MKIRLFHLLDAADLIYVDGYESEALVYDDSFLVGRKEQTARLVYDDTDYFFLDQDVEFVDGKCIAISEDWEAPGEGDSCELDFRIIRGMTDEDVKAALAKEAATGGAENAAA